VRSDSADGLFCSTSHHTAVEAPQMEVTPAAACWVEVLPLFRSIPFQVNKMR